MAKEGYTVVYEKRLEGFLENAKVDYKKTAFGEAGFTVLTSDGCC